MKKLRSFYGSKNFNVFLFVIYFIIPFVVYWNLFQDNMVPISGDGVGYFSLKLLLNNALKSGQFPLWNSYLSNGIPYAGDLNGVFYPISLVLSFLPAKMFIYSYYSIHLAIGAFFTYLFLKEINCDKIVSICTSMIYLLSIHLNGYRKSHMVIIAAVVYLPVILYFIEKYVRTQKLKYLVLASAAMALAVLSGGHIQNSVYADMAVFAYFIIRMFLEKISLKKMLANILLWGFMFLGFAAVQLIPAMELLFNYQSAGANGTSYETFATYSIHPIKIIMMLFPNMFGTDVYSPMGGMYSSEMDVEIFLGVGILLLLLFAIKNYWKDNRVKIATAFMGGAIIYAANAHIPVLNKIIYHIPVLGGFRVSSRMLFVFIFFSYVLFAVALTKMREAKDVTRFAGFITKIFIAISGVLLIVTPFIYIVSFDATKDILKVRYENFQLVYVKPMLTIFVLLIAFQLFSLMQRKGKKIRILLYPSISIFMLIITVAETSRFSMLSNPTTITDFGVADEATQKIENNIGNGKVWLASPAIDGGTRSIIEFNSNVAKKMPAINAYITFNNPRLFRMFTNENIMKPYYNFSGLLTGFPDAKNNLLCQNDLLSMLGIKYIIDPSNLITEKGSIIKSMDTEETIYTNSSVQIVNQSGALYIYSDSVNVEPDTYYKISFQAETASEQNRFYIDFYGGEAYDNAQQNASFSISAGTNTYEAIVNSDDSTAALTAINFRIVSNPTADINISNITITKMKVEEEDNVYIPYYIDNQTRIYENTRAKNILYSPVSVESINDFDSLYSDVKSYDLDDVSYIEASDIGYTTGNTAINNIEMKSNSISAKVESDEKTFVNFSQNYYPGWKAYVDGKKTELYMVNGLIQGIEVPAGEHAISFRFVPTSVIIGLLILFFTIIAVAFLLVIEKKNKKY